jgi:hypothetical protein
MQESNGILGEPVDGIKQFTQICIVAQNIKEEHFGMLFIGYEKLPVVQSEIWRDRLHAGKVFNKIRRSHPVGGDCPRMTPVVALDIFILTI